MRVFAGPNNFVLKRELDDTKSEFVAEHGDLALEVIDAEEAGFGRLLSAVESVPFLSDKKMVIVYKLGALKEAGERVEELADIAGNTELIIVEQKPDRRSSYYKFLKKNTDMAEFSEPDERELGEWLVKEAEKAGAKLSQRDAYYLVQRVGGNQESTYNELKKLIDYGKDISKETIDELTEASPQTSIFNLLDAAFAGNSKKAMAIYDEQRIQGEEPLKILGMIVWQVHLVAMVESAGKLSDKDIMSASGLKPFTLNKSRSIARRMGRKGIKDILDRLLKLDRQLKTTMVDADDALKNLLATIS